MAEAALDFEIETVRASALPIAFLCGASARASDVPINESGDAANIGTAAHEALRALAETGSLDWESIPRIAEKHHADPDEVRMLAALGAKLWPSVSASFPDAMTEVALSSEIASGWLLTGHLDLLSITGTVARAGDWKTGRRDDDHSQQMRGYAALVLLDNAELTEVTVTVLWVREQMIENYTMTRESLASWVRDCVASVVAWDGVYRPGAHCSRCKRSHECPAANALVRRDVAALTDRALVARAESELALMTPVEIVSLHAKAKLVAGYADRVVDAIKAHILANGDIVADGVRLTIETESRRGLDPLKAWPVLEAAGFDDADFGRCVDIRISKAEKVAAEKAGRGKGAAAVRALGDALAAADAIETKETKRLATKRA